MLEQIDLNEVFNLDGDDPVYEIAAETFMLKCGNMPNLTTIKFNYCTNVGDCAFMCAFEGCQNLRTVEFERLMYVGMSGFESCNMGGCDLTFPNLRSIGTHAFALANIKSFTAPHLEYVEREAFHGSSLIAFSSGGAREVRDHAFENCHKLQNVHIPGVEDLTSADFAFSGCENLKELRLPSMDNVDCFAYGIFQGSGLQHLYLPRIYVDTYAREWAEFVGLPSGCTIHFSDGDIVYTPE